MRVSKWGNSLAIRIPASVAESLDLKEGSDITIRVASKSEFVIARDTRRQDALQRLRKFRGRLPAGFRFDRDEANAR